MTTLDPGSRSRPPRHFAKYLTYDGITAWYKSLSGVNQGYILFALVFPIGLTVRHVFDKYGEYSTTGIVVGIIGLILMLPLATLAIWKFIEKERANFH